MTRTKIQSILENLHFPTNDNDDKTDKSYKICPVIEHLNKVLPESLSISPFQSVDEHMGKVKGRSSIKQYIKNKQETADLFTFTGEILNGKTLFFVQCKLPKWQ